MGRSSVPRPASTQKVSAAAGADTTKPVPPEKINLNDANAIKHKLDSVVVEVITKSGYEEDFLISNVKIALGFLAIGLAALAHFAPGKFPDNWWTIFYSVVAYVLVTVVLNIFCSIKEGDSFLVTYPQPGHDVGLRVSSRMPRYSEGYQLTITSADKMQQREIRMAVSVGEYFHADGYLAEAKFRKDTEKLLLQFEQTRDKKAR